MIEKLAVPVEREISHPQWHGAEYGFGRLNSLLLLVHPEHDCDHNDFPEWRRVLDVLVADENYALCVVSGMGRCDSPKQKAYEKDVRDWINGLAEPWKGRFFHHQDGMMVPNDTEHRVALLNAFGLALNPVYSDGRERPDFYEICSDGIYKMECVLTQAVTFPCTSFTPPGVGWPNI